MFCIINQGYIKVNTPTPLANIVVLLGSVLINVVVRSFPSWSESINVCCIIICSNYS